MANAVVCDNCKTVLILDARGGEEDVDGELASWITVQGGRREWKACTRSCTIELLADGGPVATEVDVWSEQVAEVSRTLKEDGKDA
jgi:hypothetical protein